jgi:DNA repair ATPase RecN
MISLDEKDVDVINERLARIEQNQQHLSSQVSKLVSLIERMVKVEEHMDQQRDTMQRFGKKFDQVERELEELRREVERWIFVRKLVSWIFGSSVVTALLMWGLRKGG